MGSVVISRHRQYEPILLGCFLLHLKQAAEYFLRINLRDKRFNSAPNCKFTRFCVVCDADNVFGSEFLCRKRSTYYYYLALEWTRISERGIWRIPSPLSILLWILEKICRYGNQKRQHGRSREGTLLFSRRSSILIWWNVFLITLRCCIGARWPCLIHTWQCLLFYLPQGNREKLAQSTAHGSRLILLLSYFTAF